MGELEDLTTQLEDDAGALGGSDEPVGADGAQHRMSPPGQGLEAVDETSDKVHDRLEVDGDLPVGGQRKARLSAQEIGEGSEAGVV